MNMIEVGKLIESLYDRHNELQEEFDRLEGLYNAQADLNGEYFKDVEQVKVTIEFPDGSKQGFDIDKDRLLRMVAEDVYFTENYLKRSAERIKAGCLEG